MLIAATSLAGARAAPAADNGAWSVFPTPVPNARLFFTPTARPGSVYRDTATVTNRTTQRLTFNLYAADAFITSDGVFSLGRRTDPKRDVGAWTRLPYSVINLGPHTALQVPFQIDIPRNASPGDHTGGIVAERTTGAYTQSGALGVTVLQAVAARIYVRVTGPLRPALRIEGVRLNAHRSTQGLVGGPIGGTLSFTVENSGNVRILRVQTAASLKPLVGGSMKLPSIALGELLPGTRLRITQHFRSLEPFVVLRAHVSVTSPTAHAAKNAQTLVVPWVLIAVLIALGAAAVYLWRHRRTDAHGTTDDDRSISSHDRLNEMPDGQDTLVPGP
jgi:hypothetical protein